MRARYLEGGEACGCDSVCFELLPIGRVCGSGRSGAGSSVLRVQRAIRDGLQDGRNEAAVGDA